MLLACAIEDVTDACLKAKIAELQAYASHESNLDQRTHSLHGLSLAGKSNLVWGCHGRWRPSMASMAQEGQTSHNICSRGISGAAAASGLVIILMTMHASGLSGNQYFNPLFVSGNVRLLSMTSG